VAGGQADDTLLAAVKLDEKLVMVGETHCDRAMCGCLKFIL